MNYIYLDDAATSKPLQVVIDAMMPYMTMKWYNPSALYNKAKEVYDMMIKSGAKVVAQEDGKTTFDNGVIVYHSDGHLEVDSGAFGSPCALMNALDASGLNEDCVMVFDGDESVQYEGMKNDSGEVFFHTTKVDFGQDGINVKHQSNSEYVGK